VTVRAKTAGFHRFAPAAAAIFRRAAIVFNHIGKFARDSAERRKMCALQNRMLSPNVLANRGRTLALTGEIAS
jgi:hypothetical protein